MTVSLSQGEATAIVVKAARGFGLSWGLAEEAGWALCNWGSMEVTRFFGLNAHLMGQQKTVRLRLGQPLWITHPFQTAMRNWGVI